MYINRTILLTSFREWMPLAFVLAFLVCSCGPSPAPSNATRHLSSFDDSVVNYNKQSLVAEDQQIEDFIARYGWKMTLTPTGLRHFIYSRGTGPQAKEGMTARIRYTINLLSGNRCYSSDELGLKEMKIGASGENAGLEEGILLLHQGDRAKFIVPSHLAFGLLGDQDKIPPQAVLVYDVELISFK